MAERTTWTPVPTRWRPSMRGLTRAWLLALVAVVVPRLVLAQATPPSGTEPSGSEAELPPVIVRDRAEDEAATAPVPGYTVRRSATATRTDTPLAEVPQSVSVITADQIEDQDAQTLQEVLRYTPGVRSEMYGLDNRGDWFSLRGSGDSPVLLDGLRVPLTGWYGVLRSEPYAFERVEVLRGPSSVIAGQNAPGGVVNMVSKRPQAEAAREVVLQAGNQGHKQVAIDATGPLGSDRFLYRLVALGRDSGTQVEHADERRLLVAPSLTWKPMDGTSLTVFAEYQRDRSGNVNGFFGIEGTLDRAPNGFIPVDTFIGEPDWDRYGGERKRVGYRLEHQLGDGWTLRHGLRHDRIDGDQRSMYAAWWMGFSDQTGAADPDGTYLNRLWYATDDMGRVTNADLALEGRLVLGPTRHTVLVGGDGMVNNNDQRTWDDDFATPLDVYHPVYGTFPEPPLGELPSNLAETRTRTAGLILQDQVKITEWLVVVGALRYDRARTDSHSTLGDGSTDTSRQDDTAFSKNLGVVFLAGGGFSPYAGYSESFEPVAGTNLDGEAFEPKRGRQLEVGVKWAPAASRASASAAVYGLRESNRLMEDPARPGNSVQRGEVTVKGLELEAAADLSFVELVAGYAFTDARQTEVGAEDVRYLDLQLGGIPKHTASLWAVHRFGRWGPGVLRGLRVGAGVRHAGETTDGIDLTTTPSVTLLDALLSYDRGPWHVAVNVANLTDKTYIATCLERGDCWYGTKRKAHLSAGYRW